MLSGSSPTTHRLARSRSASGVGGLPKTEGHGEVLHFTTGLERSQRIPTCFSSHKAMAKLFETAPDLFTDSVRNPSAHHNFYPVDMRHVGNQSVASMRKKMLGAPDEAARARTSRSIAALKAEMEKAGEGMTLI
mmetsp:Transcript_27866/g.64742  ORF Transcript_27866/g.64742 Transcript_27866/m.64742 type:complete len:134 (+) Transcript_27866:80-481(+)